MTLLPKLDHNQFLSWIAPFEEKLREMESAPPLRYPIGEASLPQRGIYIFFEGDQALYVGRSNTIRQRLRQHQIDSSGTNAASFAVILVREKLKAPRTYHILRTSPEHAFNHPDFGTEFALAKQRIRAMTIRVIEETDPTLQALLEIYIAKCLGAPYNDFDNH